LELQGVVMPTIPARRLSLASRARVAAFAGGIVALLGATAAQCGPNSPPSSPSPGNGPGPPVMPLPFPGPGDGMLPPPRPQPPIVVPPPPVAHPPPPPVVQPPPVPVVTRPAVPVASMPPKPVAPQPATAPTAGPGSVNVGRITEIIPQASYPTSGAQARGWSGATPGALGAAAWSTADPCVNVFVRSAKLDGREVVSVDLHGDGLIKGAVAPQLAGALLARAGPPTGAGGARTACVPPALAQSLFDPVINLAAVDPALTMTRVGDRWVLAGSRAPEAVAKASAPVQLAAATTRGAAKQQAKRSSAPAKPRPVQVSYNIYP